MLAQIFGTSDTDISVLANTDSLVHYDGDSWTSYALPSAIQAGWPIGVNDALLVGESGILGREQDGHFAQYTTDFELNVTSMSAECPSSYENACGLSSAEIVLAGSTQTDAGSVGVVYYWNGLAFTKYEIGGAAVVMGTDNLLGRLHAFVVGASWNDGGVGTHPDSWYEEIGEWNEFPVPDASTGQLNAVWSDVDAGRWAVGSVGPDAGSPAIYGSLPAGTPWARVPYAALDGGPNEAGVPSTLWAISGSTGSDVWAVGDLVVHWDGHQWSQSPAPSGVSTLTSVVAVAANDVWAAGCPADFTTAAVAHWDGGGWTTTTLVLETTFSCDHPVLWCDPTTNAPWLLVAGTLYKYADSNWVVIGVPGGISHVHLRHRGP